MRPAWRGRSGPAIRRWLAIVGQFEALCSLAAYSFERPDDPFPEGAELRLADFASLVAQAVVNLESRRELAALVQEQAALRRVATLVAGGKPQAEVLEAVMREAGAIFGAHAIALVRWEGVQDEVVVVASWRFGPIGRGRVDALPFTTAPHPCARCAME